MTRGGHRLIFASSKKTEEEAVAVTSILAGAAGGAPEREEKEAYGEALMELSEFRQEFHECLTVMALCDADSGDLCVVLSRIVSTFSGRRG